MAASSTQVGARTTSAQGAAAVGKDAHAPGTRPRVEYGVRAYTAADEHAVLNLMRAALGESETLRRTGEMWRWKHHDSPFGASHALLAVTPGERIIGLRAFMRWGWAIDGRAMTAVRAVDTSTHPDFQRMGIFSRLTKRAVDDVTDQGVNFVFNTPNEKSLPGYLKLGWETVGLVEPIIKVLSYPRFLLGMAKHRLLGRASKDVGTRGFFRADAAPSLVSEMAADERLGGLIAADANLWAGRLHTDRSAAYVAWRYANHPTIKYRCVVAEDGGRMEGAAIFRTNSRFGMREVVVTELLLARSDYDIVRKLVARLRSVVRADYLISYFPPGSFHREALARQGFRRTPGQGMTLVANKLSPASRKLPDLAGWGVSLGDLEFF